MTRPSSYVFYPEHLTGEITREEGTKLVRVFVTDRTLTIFEKEIVRTKKSGVLFEKVLSQQTLAVHENSHGQKYLKFLRKSLTGGIKDVSLGHHYNFAPKNYVLLVTIRETILGWFEGELDKKQCNWYRGLSISAMVSQLMFPATRDPRFLNNVNVFDLLRSLHGIGYPVLRLLRECGTWDEFLPALCPTFGAQADVDELEHNIFDLLHVAVMPLGRSLISLQEEYGADQILLFKKSFSIYDHTLIRFMMENSTPDEREESFRDLMTLVALFSRIKLLNRMKTLPYSSSLHSQVTRELDFEQIPRKSWRELANLLRAQIKTLCEEFSKDSETNPRLQNPVIETRLSDTVRGWYAERFFEPRMRTERTLTDIETRFHQLFHAAPWETDRPHLHRFTVRWQETKEGTVFMRLPIEDPWAPNASKASDLLLLLIQTVPRKDRVKRSGRGFNAYFEDGEVKYLPGDVWSIDEVLSLIETRTAAVDAELARLDQPLTPESRTAYLRCDPKERKFKNTWKYYDWGVRDSEKVLALKKCGVKNKKDVQMYDALPDEMFYELLSLGFGEELAPSRAESNL